MMKKLFAILIAIASTSSIAHADLVRTKDQAAVCSNGKQAAFVVSKSKSKDWFIYFEGGGVATSPDAYKQRQSRWKKPITDGNYGLSYPIVKDFKKKGFNVVVIPYCTSDLHQGAHTNIVDGKKVYFHGRKIVEDVFNQMDGNFKSANELVFAGYSAGAIALGFNSDQ